MEPSAESEGQWVEEFSYFHHRMEGSLSVPTLKRPLQGPRDREHLTIPRKEYTQDEVTVPVFVFVVWQCHGLTAVSPEAGIEKRTPLMLYVLILSPHCGLREGKWNSVLRTLRFCLSAGDNELQFIEWGKRNKLSFEVKTIFDQSNFIVFLPEILSRALAPRNFFVPSRRQTLAEKK